MSNLLAEVLTWFMSSFSVGDKMQAFQFQTFCLVNKKHDSNLQLNREVFFGKKIRKKFKFGKITKFDE